MSPRRALPAPAPTGPRRSERGSVLIIVLWISFGLVSLALYFAHTMNFELRAADNRVAATLARQAIEGAARYASNVLVNLEEPGAIPDILTHRTEAVPVGDAAFWFLGRNPESSWSNEPWFGFVDEASKLNLNTATANMLEQLPGMTPEFAAAIIDWRDSDSDLTDGGAEDETYQRLNPPYRCKNAPFESLEELRLVYGADLLLLYGDDANLNGLLDPNEDDGENSPPADNRDGRLDPGLFEYLTVSSREPNTAPDGSTRINVSSTNRTELASLLEEHLGADRANEILRAFGTPGGGGGGGGGPGGGGAGAAVTVRSVLEFYLVSGMTTDEFAQVEGYLSVSTNQFTEGLVNVNTASETVLACLPGIGPEFASTLVASRPTLTRTEPPSLAWVADVLERENAVEAGPYLTARSYQFTVDIAALGQHGRGYQRVKYIFDTSGSAPRIRYRQDLTHLGWALGPGVREELQQARREGTIAFGTLGTRWGR
ncbi:MAG: general secretion pathway protein GspK [Verrucomicrobiales bacterium]|nr:general secretion pathway protein GspK [Verrucomicrobiales bacterium]